MAYSQAKLETGATKIDITSEGRGSSFGKVSKGLTTLYLRVLVMHSQLLGSKSPDYRLTIV